MGRRDQRCADNNKSALPGQWRPKSLQVILKLEEPTQDRGLPRWLSGKDSACNAGDTGLSPGLGRSPGEGNDNPLQYFYLDNPMDGGAWRATVHGVKKSCTQLSNKTTRDGSSPTSKEQRNWFLAQPTPLGLDQSWWLESVPVSKKCALDCSLEPYMGVGSMGRWLRLALALVTSYLDGKSTPGHLLWEVWVFYLCRNSWKQCVALQVWALLPSGDTAY